MLNPTATRWRRVVIGAVGVAAAVAATASLQAPNASAATTTVKTGDAGWQLASTPSTSTPAAATTVTTRPLAWGDIPASAWIGTKAVADGSDPIGTYVFEAPVTLAQASTLTGSVLAAPSATLELVQGATVVNVGTFASATTPTAISYATPVAAGSWTARFTITTTALTDVGVSALLTFDDNVAPGATTTPTTPPEATLYHALPAPIRVYDSRTGTGAAANNDGPLAFGTVRTVSLAQGYSSPSATTKVAAVPAGATSAVVNLTIDGTTQQGFLTLYAANVDQPASSSINWFGTGQILANTNIVALAPDGTIKVTAGGPGSAQVIIDVLGYYTSAAAAAPVATTTTLPATTTTTVAAA